MLLLSARWKRGGYPAGSPPNASADMPGAATYRQPGRTVPGARRPAVLLDQVGTSVQKLGGGCVDYAGQLMTGVVVRS
jgi:hypothetical protein